MAQFFEIPTGSGPRMMTIALGANSYEIRLAYADAFEGGWFIDIADAQGNPLIAGLALTAGLDMLQPYPDLGIGAKLYLVADVGAPPLAYDNLGVSWHLIFTVD